MIMKKTVLFIFMLFAAGTVYSGGKETAHQKALQKWQEMRFGLFIHWGPVSLKGTEIGWSRGGERRGYKWGPGTEVPVEEYDKLYTQFNPTLFNAKEWVQIARKAGMKYLVFTSRHHDGFSMFDTQASEYKITSPASPFRRDVVKELAEACHQSRLGFGLYYSQPDWHNPDAFTPDRHDRYLAYLKAQVRELLTNYGRLDILWFDGLGKTAEEYGGAEINQMARELQPHLIINNRNGLAEDFDTPEQRIGKFQNDRPWESCITICQQWAWKPNDKLKSLQECLHTLISCAGGDGNLLLNVGPMPDGRIEPRQVERLEEIGGWLQRNGEGIYGSRGGPFKPGAWGASTHKGKDVYLFVFQHPADGKLVLPALPVKVKRARLLKGESIPVTVTDSEMQLFIPEHCKDEMIIVLKLQMDGSLPAIIL
jgi:alpha-L-fucosidase